MWSCRNLAGLWNTCPHPPSIQQEIILAQVIYYFILHTICVCGTLYSNEKEAAINMRQLVWPDLFSRWVIPMEAWPILNEIALGQQFPAGLDCIIRLFWTCASPMSELAAAIELLLLPICTQRIEWLLQPCPGSLLAKQYSGDAHAQARMACIWAENTSRCTHNMAQHAVWNWF